MEIKLRDKLSGNVRFPEDYDSRKIIPGIIITAPASGIKLRDWRIPESVTGITVVTARDLETRNYLDFPGAGRIPLLAWPETQWKGQPVMLICGKDRGALDDYSQRCTDALTRLSRKKPSPLKMDSPLEVRQIRQGAKQTSSRKKGLAVKETVSISLPGFPLTQPWSACCLRVEDRYSLHTASQWPQTIQQNGARLLGIRKEMIITENHPADYIGHNRLILPTLVSCCALLLAHASDKNVSITMDGSLDSLPVFDSGDFKFDFKMTLNPDFRPEAIEIDLVHQAGSVSLFTGEILDRVCHYLLTAFSGASVTVNAKAVSSDSPPSDGGPGMGQAIAAMALSLFRETIRERSPDIPPDWLFQSPMTSTKRSASRGDTPTGEWNTLLLPLLAESDFLRKSESSRLTTETKSDECFHYHPLRGYGLSLGMAGANFIRKHPDFASLSVSLMLDKEGKLFIKPSTLPCHAELYEFWRMMGESILSVPRQNIHFLSESIYGTGILSRNVTLMTDLIRKGLVSIQNRRFRQPLPIEVNKTISGKQGKSWDPDLFSGEPYSGVSRAGAVIEVVMDYCTSRPVVNHIWFTADCGLVLNEGIARSILESEIHSALDLCQNQNLSHLSLIRGERLPQISLRFLPGGDEPLGIEGLAFSTIPGAYLQAINQTLNNPVLALPFNVTDIRKGLRHVDPV